MGTYPRLRSETLHQFLNKGCYCSNSSGTFPHVRKPLLNARLTKLSSIRKDASAAMLGADSDDSASHPIPITPVFQRKTHLHPLLVHRQQHRNVYHEIHSFICVHDIYYI